MVTREASGRWTLPGVIGLSQDQQMEPSDTGAIRLIHSLDSSLMRRYEQQACHRMEGFSQWAATSV
jgi:hypothetical protein